MANSTASRRGGRHGAAGADSPFFLPSTFIACSLNSTFSRITNRRSPSFPADNRSWRVVPNCVSNGVHASTRRDSSMAKPIGTHPRRAVRYADGERPAIFSAAEGIDASMGNGSHRLARIPCRPGKPACSPSQRKNRSGSNGGPGIIRSDTRRRRPTYRSNADERCRRAPHFVV